MSTNTSGENNTGAPVAPQGAGAVVAPAVVVAAADASSAAADTSTSSSTIKIDPITALQDDIDKLSLAMFEALRGLRDAVAPESGSLGGNAPATNTKAEQPPDMDEVWQAYKSGDAATVQKVKAANNGVDQKISSRQDFVRVHAKMEMNKDAELVSQLAGTVLAKSREIDQHVDELPGMHRTRKEQVARIEQLLQANQETTAQLEEAYGVAKERRDACRTFVRDSTGTALGIEQE